ncbi:hypothetical protein JTB14_035504 [Gonioctena quinquepunctata]|nr:hypothetical protein JTB14_035504 [Gonioctena quinquepunctata]
MKFGNLNEDNLFAIQTKLLDVDWVFNDVNDVNVNSLMNNLYDNCELIMNEVAPIESVVKRGNEVPWYDEELRERDRAYKNFEKTDADKTEYWERYEYYRNHFVNTLTMKKIIYYENKIDKYRYDAEQMWKNLKQLMKCEKKTYFGKIIFNINNEIKIVGKEAGMARYFNIYFVESIRDIVESIQNQTWIENKERECQIRMSKFKTLNIKE